MNVVNRAAGVWLLAMAFGGGLGCGAIDRPAIQPSVRDGKPGSERSERDAKEDRWIGRWRLDAEGFVKELEKNPSRLELKEGADPAEFAQRAFGALSEVKLMAVTLRPDHTAMVVFPPLGGIGTWKVVNGQVELAVPKLPWGITVSQRGDHVVLETKVRNIIAPLVKVEEKDTVDPVEWKGHWVLDKSESEEATKKFWSEVGGVLPRLKPETISLRSETGVAEVGQVAKADIKVDGSKALVTLGKTGPSECEVSIDKEAVMFTPSKSEKDDKTPAQGRLTPFAAKREGNRIVTKMSRAVLVFKKEGSAEKVEK